VVGFNEFAYDRGQAVGFHATLVEVQPVKDDLVEGPLQLWAAAAIKLLRVAEQVKHAEYKLTAAVEFGAGGFKLPLYLSFFQSNLIELLPDLLLRPPWFTDEVKQLIRTRGQLFQPELELIAQGIQSL
jgi:hypothetical protein